MKTIRITCETGFKVHLDDLHILQGDLKDLSKENYEKLKKEILTEGFSAPFFVWTEGKSHHWVLDGTQRLRVLKQMKSDGYDIPLLPYVPIHAESIAEAKRKLLSFASQYGQVTSQGLYEFMSSADIEFSEMDSRFRFPEIDNEKFEEEFFVDPKSSEGEDDVPEPRRTDIKMGDLWQLGVHRLLCGDATDPLAVGKLMNGEKADMAFLDPPYNTGMSSKKNGGSTRLTHMFNDKFNDDEWAHLLDGFIPLLDGCLKNDSVAYVCLDWRRSHELVPRLKKQFKFSNLIVWDKMVHGLGSDYKYTHEYIHVCKKGNPKLNTHIGDQEYQDVWHIQRTMGKDEDHATKKPIALIERAISHASRKNDIVVDLFLGSGSTLIASDKNHRQCFGMELEPVYVQTTIDRFEKFSGLRAEKIGE